jgi:zinc protease
MRSRPRFVLPLLVAIAAQAVSAAGAAPAQSALPLPDLQAWTMPNGLAVYYLGVHDSPVVAVHVYYHAGSKDEPRDRRGTAHMFEHIMFKGSTHVPADAHARMLESLGGIVNAHTQWDVTGFENTVPRQYLDFVVELEADRMRGLMFRPDMIDDQRRLVQDEKRYADEDPLSYGLEQCLSLAFIKHPYGWTPGGYVDDLEQLEPEEVQKFYDTYYQPNNAALVIVGDVGVDQVKASAEKWFGPIPKGAEPPRTTDAEPPQTELRRAISDKAEKVGLVVGAFHIPAYKDADQAALMVTASLLADGQSSRLYQRIVKKDKIGLAAGGQVLALEEPGVLIVFAAHRDADQSAKVEKALLDEVARLSSAPPGAKELEKAKNQVAARVVFSLETVDGIARQIGQSWGMTGDGKTWLGQLDRVNAVTAADVQRVAKKYLVTSNLTLLIAPVAGAEVGN